MSTYNFEEQLNIGLDGESNIDKFCVRWCYVYPAGMELQRMGIDRILINRETGTPITIEYKTDWTTFNTGNIFLETISVDTTNKPGWLYSSKAGVLVYYIPQTGKLYTVRFSKLRAYFIPRVDNYRKVSANNGTYNTWGILVPLNEFEKVCESINNIKPEQTS